MSEYRPHPLMAAALAEPGGTIMLHGRLWVSLWPLANGQYCPDEGFPEWIIEPDQFPCTTTSRVRGGPFAHWPRVILARRRGEIT
jgi:hypothetical protein